MRLIAVALALCLFAAPAWGAACSADLSSLSAGSWCTITGSSLKSFIDGTLETNSSSAFPYRFTVDATYDAGTDVMDCTVADKHMENIYQAWNGGAFDSTRQELLVHGGGHQDGCDNAVYAFNLDEQEWRLYVDASVAVARDYVSGTTDFRYDDGTPAASHTYDLLEYIPSLDSLCMFGIKSGFSSGGISCDKRIYCVDPEMYSYGSLRGWYLKGDRPIGLTSTNADVMAYDRSTGLAYSAALGNNNPGNCSGQGANQGVFDWDGWDGTDLASAVFNSRQEAIGVINPQTQILHMLGGADSGGDPVDDHMYWDLSGLTKTDISGSLPLPDVREGVGAVYSPQIGKVVAWLNDGDDLYVLDDSGDDSTWSWSTCVMSGGPAALDGQTQGTFGRFQYSHKHDLFILNTAHDDEIWVARLDTTAACGGVTRAATDLRPELLTADPPMYSALGVRLPYGGDSDFDATVGVRYRTSDTGGGAGSWVTHLDMKRTEPRVLDDYNPGWDSNQPVHPGDGLPMREEFVTLIPGLDPDTKYDVEADIDDPDGYTETQQITVKTRAAPPADPASPTTYSGTQTDTLAEVRSLLASATAGDVIELNASTTYTAGASDGFVFELDDIQGTATNPIILRCATDGTTVLDANDQQFGIVANSGGSIEYVHIENCRIRGVLPWINSIQEGGVCIEIDTTSIGVAIKDNHCEAEGACDSGQDTGCGSKGIIVGTVTSGSNKGPAKNAWIEGNVLEGPAPFSPKTITGETGSVTSGTAVVTVSDSTGADPGDEIELSDNPPTEVRTIQSVDSGTQVTTTANWTNTFSSSAMEINPVAARVWWDHIGIEILGRGHVVRNNTLTRAGDAINFGRVSAAEGVWPTDFPAHRGNEIALNDINVFADDCIEFDGAESNNIAWKNRCTNGNGSCASWQPANGANNVYARNVCFQTYSNTLKVANVSWGPVAYNNLLSLGFIAGSASCVAFGGDVRNNLWVGHETTRRVADTVQHGQHWCKTGGGTDGVTCNHSCDTIFPLDFNAYNSDDGFDWNGDSYTDVADAGATGLIYEGTTRIESSSVALSPGTTEDIFADGAAMTLRPTSSCSSQGCSAFTPTWIHRPIDARPEATAETINAGTALGGFTDGATGNPDIGPIEAGDAMPSYGAPSYAECDDGLDNDGDGDTDTDDGNCAFAADLYESPCIQSFAVGSFTNDANGSDNWPVTWHSDDVQYVAYGDGGGFDADQAKCRASNGTGTVTGTSTDPSTWTLANLGGCKTCSGTNCDEAVGCDASCSTNNPYQFANQGKMHGLLSVGGTTYQAGDILYATICGTVTGTGSSGSCYEEEAILKSTNDGESWTTLTTWDHDTAFGNNEGPFAWTIVNMGQGYDDAIDSYIYMAGPEQQISEWAIQIPGEIMMARVTEANLATQASYEWFAGFVDGSPTWSDVEANRSPIVENATGFMRTTITYNTTLGRFILIAQARRRSTGDTAGGATRDIAIYESTHPWGPYDLILQEDATSTSGIASPNAMSTGSKTVMYDLSTRHSADGLTMTMTGTFPGDDQFGAAQVTLTAGPVCGGVAAAAAEETTTVSVSGGSISGGSVR